MNIVMEPLKLIGNFECSKSDSFKKLSILAQILSLFLQKVHVALFIYCENITYPYLSVSVVRLMGLDKLCENVYCLLKRLKSHLFIIISLL